MFLFYNDMEVVGRLKQKVESRKLGRASQKIFRGSMARRGNGCIVSDMHSVRDAADGPCSYFIMIW